MISWETISEHSLSAWAVTVNKAKPLAISSAVGVILGVSELGFIIILLLPTKVVFVQRIEFALFTVIKSGKVKVSAHNVISVLEAIIVGFFCTVISIWSVTSPGEQFILGITRIVKVTVDKSFGPNL